MPALEPLSRHWQLVVAVTLMFGLFGYLISTTLPERYEAEASVAFTLRPERVVGGDIVRLELSKYSYFVTSAATIQRVADDLGIDSSELTDGTSAVFPGETATFFIRVALASPQEAQNAANQLSNEIVAFAETDAVLNASILSPAVLPVEPTGAPTLVLIAAALAVGAIIGLASAALLDQLRPRVHTAQQASMLTGLPVVGSIPRVKGNLRRAEDLFAPAALDALPAVRVLTGLVPGAENQAVTVTSPTSGDGKSLVAALLAHAYANLGFSVLLVEANTRPTLFNDELDDEPGLFAIIENRAALEDAVRPGPFPGVSLLPAGDRNRRVDVAPYLAASLVEELKKHADLVIIDASHLVGGDLGHTFAAAGDESILVVPRKASVGDVRMAAAVLARHAHGGIVLFNDHS